ncbi:MAG: hypothetical protein V4558_15960 [Gemmatimonadota bacterium]
MKRGLLVLLFFVASKHLAAQQCPRGIDYVTTFGSDTISVEHGEFRSDSLVGSLLGMGGPNQWSFVRYEAVFGADGMFRAFGQAIWPIAGDSVKAPAQVSVVSFGPRTITATVTDVRRGAQVQTDSVAAGTLPYMDNVPFFLAAIVRRVVLLQRDTVLIPTLWLHTGGHQEVFTVVKRGADSLQITTPRVSWRVAVSDGRLLGAFRSDSVSVARGACR